MLKKNRTKKSSRRSKRWKSRSSAKKRLKIVSIRNALLVKLKRRRNSKKRLDSKKSASAKTMPPELPCWPKRKKTDSARKKLRRTREISLTKRKERSEENTKPLKPPLPLSRLQMPRKTVLLRKKLIKKRLMLKPLKKSVSVKKFRKLKKLVTKPNARRNSCR